MGILRLSAFAVVCLGLGSTGCVQTDFQQDKARGIVAAAPVHLDAEQVMLTLAQVDCGAQNDLGTARSADVGTFRGPPSPRRKGAPLR